MISYVVRFIGWRELDYLWDELWERIGVYRWNPDYSPDDLKRHLTPKMKRWYIGP